MNWREIVVHYADFDDPNLTAATVDVWHRQAGYIARGSNPLKNIGYNRFIRADGTIELGRSEDVIGCHCKGHNETALGVCLAGSDRVEWYPTREQYIALEAVCRDWMARYGIPLGSIVRHGQFYPTDCPGARFSLPYLLERLQGGASTVNIIDIQQIDLVQHPGAYRGIGVVRPQGVGNSCAFKIKFPPGLFKNPPLLFISQPNSATNWGASVGTSDVTVDGATVYLIDRGAPLDSAIIGLGIMAWTID